MSPVALPGRSADAFVALHECGTKQDLVQCMMEVLSTVVPEVGAAVCLADDLAGLRVQCSTGAFGAAPGDDATPIASTTAADRRLPIRFRTYSLGELLLDRAPGAAGPILEAAVAHFGAALGNLTLNEASRRDNDDYFALLQLDDEGLVLFQEQDPEAALAGLLNVARTNAVRSNAGALWVLREIGDPSSGLSLQQALGIPDSMLQGLRCADPDAVWPDALLGRAAHFATPESDGSLAMIAAGCVPPALRNVVVVPLRCNGMDAGLCVLFNAEVDGLGEGDVLRRLRRLGEVGAVLLHRLRLEALHAKNRSRERELEIAETIQKRSLPTVAPKVPGLSFAWRSVAAENIGGDYLDVFSTDGSDVHAIVADASGHGINSALLMSSFRSNYRAHAARRALPELVASLNDEVVAEVGPTGMFVTSVFLRIDPSTRRMQICSAGHTPVLILRAASGTVERVDSMGPPLGFMAGTAFESHEATLGSGDLVLLHTDGVTEATDADLEMFGEEALVEEMRRHHAATPDVCLGAIHRRLAAFTGRTRYDDDVSMVLIRAE